MRVQTPAGASSIALALLLAAFGAGLACAYDLTGASLTEENDRAILEVTASEPPRYEVIRLSDPDRVVLDLMDAQEVLEPAVRRCEGAGWLLGVRHSLWRDDPSGRVVRYVLEAGGPVVPVVEEDGCLVRVIVQRSPAGEIEPLPVPPAPGQEELPAQADAVDVNPPESAALEAPIETAPSPLEAPIDTAPSLGHVDPGLPIEAQFTADPAPSGGRGAPMNLDAQGADIRTVLRSISEFGKVNIVPDRTIDGPISIHLVQVPWRDALDIVCAAAALTAVEHDDVIRVAERRTFLEEEIDAESAARKKEELLPLETAILPVKYANADELKESISFVLSKRGSLEVDARTNSILITDIADRIAQIAAMVNRLDTETMQVEIVAKLVDVDVTAARLMGISWNLQNLHSDSERLSGSIEHSSPIEGATTELKFGVIRRWGNIDGVVQALEQENKANIISNPSITTVNNRKARILVGKQIPLITLDQAGNPITELKKVGITLEVTPYINSENRVTMDLHPEVSDLSSQATVQGGIVFTTTEADTRIMVADGETAVIGGLISQSELRFSQGIPILKSIPWLGRLFSSDELRKTNRELLIFVTPRIVRNMASAE